MVKQRKMEFESHMSVEQRAGEPARIEWVFDQVEADGEPDYMVGRMEVAYVKGGRAPDDGAFIVEFPLRHLDTEERRIERIGFEPVDIAAIGEMFTKLAESWQQGAFDAPNIGGN